MGQLLDAALELPNLQRALEELVKHDLEDGAPADGVTRLALGGDEMLLGLAATVRAGQFEARSLTAVMVPKPNGGVRELALPCPTERLLERALLRVLTPVLDPLLGSSSYAFRPGLGVGHAIRRVVALRDDGLRWVAHTDIDDCFPSLDRNRIRRLIGVALDDRDMVALLGILLERPVRHGARTTWPERGIPQGSPLSPLMCNLYLADLDAAIERRGFPVVRYADDLVVFATNRQEAFTAMEITRQAADELGLRLGEDKSEVLDFETGFCFLGEDINHRYPPADHEPIDHPGRRSLYVGVQGSFVALRNGRVLATRDKHELLSVPSGHVSRLVVFGSVTISPAIIGWAAANDVEVVMCSRRGGFIGWLSPAGTTVTATRRLQFERSMHLPLALAVGAAMETGKLHNQRTLLQRRLRPDTVDALRPAIAQIAGYLSTLSAASDRNELLGVEGIAAREYFGALKYLVPGPIGFNGRQTRPPGDVFNAALSYGYAILVGECTTALAAAGLDPAIGFLHVDNGARPSLALDLAEEFRPLIIDSVVLALSRDGQLDAHHGRSVQDGRGVLLTEDGRRTLVAAVERRLLTLTFHVGSQRQVSYRRAIFLQAQSVARIVRSGECDYQPMLWRS